MSSLFAQVPNATPPIQGTKGSGQAGTPASTSNAGGQQGEQGGESKSASGRQSALSPTDPAAPPPRAFSRPRIGLALGGGGALALSEIGALQWFEEHHIPVDVIAGTSMGCMVSALYSTGRTPEQLTGVMNDRVFSAVFTFSNAYTSRSFRRREDSRELPNGITVGLKHRISLRNSVLTDQGLNAFLDRQFLRYDDQTDFNTLPIPLRCISTDLNQARAVTFARGSIPDAVRASVSLPGVFSPFELKGHEYVDGGVTENLPTKTVHQMQADVVLAFSLPLAPVATGELGSILGVFQRSFVVGIEAAEREQRKSADVVIMPDISGYTANDYLKAPELAKRGYAATEQHRSELLKYAVSDADWEAYLAHRASLRRGPAGPVLRVRISASTESATLAIERLFAPLVNQPVDTAKIEALLDQVRADGGYDADYTVGYETAQHFAAEAAGKAPLPAGTVPVPAITDASKAPASAERTSLKEPGAPNPKPGAGSSPDQPQVPPAVAASIADRPGAPGFGATQLVTPESLADISARPVILVNVVKKKNGPPFLLVGANVESQTPAFTRATIEGILVDQNFLSYGSELRSTVKIGYLTQLGTEYFHPLNPLASPEHTVFVAPHISLLREPFPIYRDQVHLANRQFQSFATGADIGWTNQRTQELRVGFEFAQIHWLQEIGVDGGPDILGGSQRAQVRYDYDTQDRALVPQFGLHFTTEAGFLYSAVDSPNAPQLLGRAAWAHRFSLHKAPKDAAALLNPHRGHEVFIMGGEAGTMFHRNVADPFRFTLGGPFRLSASAIDQYRGTDYFLVEPGLLRRIAQLPEPLGQSIYIGGGFEFGQIHAPNLPTITREDVYFGFIAETPLGVITLAPSIGSNGERKFVFTLGRLF